MLDKTSPQLLTENPADPGDDEIAQWQQFGVEVRTYLDERLGFGAETSVADFVNTRLGQERAVGVAEVRQSVSGVVEQQLAQYRADEISQLAAAVRDGNALLRELIAQIAAPKALVMDAAGNPIGIRTGEPLN